MDTSSLSTSELLKILDISRHLSEKHMVQPLMTFVATTVFELIPAERCLIALFTSDDGFDVPVSRTRQGTPIPQVNDQVSRSIVQKVRSTLTPMIVDDAIADAALFSARSVRDLRLRSVMCVPLISHGQAIGVIYVENRTAGGQFQESDLLPLVLFANHVVVALENARMMERLELTVAERTKELSQAIVHLRATQNQLIQSEKMAALGNMVAGVAHELRNPLNFINNLALLSIDLSKEVEELAQSADPQNLPALHESLNYLRRNAQEIYNNGVRASDIITRMLHHSRSNNLQFVPTNINALLATSYELAYQGLLTQIPSLPVIQRYDLFQNDLPLIEVLPQRLSQAFMNLFDNACYALWERSCREPQLTPVIEIATEAIGSRVSIRIRDHGTGIVSDLRHRLFEPFVTTKPPGFGTGLGLSLAYDIIVHEHNGHIEIYSEPNQYTEVIIRLPIQAQRSTQRQTQPHEQTSIG